MTQGSEKGGTLGAAQGTYLGDYPIDQDFTGDQLLRLILDIQDAVGANKAGLTPLGRAIMEMTERAWRRTSADAGSAPK